MPRSRSGLVKRCAQIRLCGNLTLDIAGSTIQEGRVAQEVEDLTMAKSDFQALDAISRSEQLKVIEPRKSKAGAKEKLGPADRSHPIQALVLIPLSYNDQSLIPQEILDELLDQIYLFAEGYTIKGIVKGAYKMASGDKCVEQLMEVMVVFKAAAKTQFETMVSEWASELGQETMSVTYSNFEVTFVKPRTKGD